MSLFSATAAILLSAVTQAGPEEPAGRGGELKLRVAEHYNDNVEVLFDEEQAGPGRFSPSLITEFGAEVTAEAGEIEGVRFTLMPEAEARLFSNKPKLSMSRFAPEIIASWKPAADMLLTAADEYTLLLVPETGRYSYHRNVAYLSFIPGRVAGIKLKLEYRNKLKMYPGQERWNFFTNLVFCRAEWEASRSLMAEAGYGVQHNIGSAGRLGVMEVRLAEGFEHAASLKLKSFILPSLLVSLSWDFRAAAAGSYEERGSPDVSPGGLAEDDADETSNGGFLKNKLEVFAAYRPVEQLSLNAMSFFSKKSYDRLFAVDRGDLLRRDEAFFASVYAEYDLAPAVSAFLKYFYLHNYSTDSLRRFENSVLTAGMEMRMR